MTTVMKKYPPGTAGAEEGFRKVYWTDGERRTAGLIFTTQYLRGKTVSELSRHWPAFEAPLMKKLIMLPVCKTFEEAFNSH